MSDRGIRVWTMRVDRLEEADIGPWRGWLDAAEIARADRFVYPRSRIEFTSAHALTRWLLGEALGCDGRALSFVQGSHGKPEVRLDERPTSVSFNLSHTKGMVALAINGDAEMPLGVDVENLARSVDLKIADSYFVPREVSWLTGLPDTHRAEGFLRLWTLKEAFIKATGKGLTQSLSSFGFEVAGPQIYFTDTLDDAPVADDPVADDPVADDPVADDPTLWRFRQKIIDECFVAAVGWRDPEAALDEPVWVSVAPREIPVG